MSETSQHKLYWLPNALTVGRILLIPVLVWALLFDINVYLPTVLFVICMLTDFLDGKLARSWNVTSDFGRMLDPIADKLLVAVTLICFCILKIGFPYLFDAQALLIIPAFVIICRDITVSGIREYAALNQKVMPPTKLAKWKTAAEMLAILILLIHMGMIVEADWKLQANFLTHEGYKEAILSHAPLMDEFLYAGYALLWLAAILSAYTGFLYFRAALAKHET